MKAVRLFEFGGPDKLVYGDYPLPEGGTIRATPTEHQSTVRRRGLQIDAAAVHDGRAMTLAGERDLPLDGLLVPRVRPDETCGHAGAVRATLRALAGDDRRLGVR